MKRMEEDYADLLESSGIKHGSRLYKQLMREYTVYKALPRKIKFRPLFARSIKRRMYNVYMSDGSESPNNYEGPSNVRPVANRNKREKVFTARFYPVAMSNGKYEGFISFNAGESFQLSSFQIADNGQLHDRDSYCWIAA